VLPPQLFVKLQHQSGEQCRRTGRQWPATTGNFQPTLRQRHVPHQPAESAAPTTGAAVAPATTPASGARTTAQFVGPGRAAVPHESHQFGFERVQVEDAAQGRQQQEVRLSGALSRLQQLGRRRWRVRGRFELGAVVALQRFQVSVEALISPGPVTKDFFCFQIHVEVVRSAQRERLPGGEKSHHSQ
jgi:hypothetical protein